MRTVRIIWGSVLTIAGILLITLTIIGIIHTCGEGFTLTLSVKEEVWLHEVGPGRSASQFICPDGYSFTLVLAIPTNSSVVEAAGLILIRDQDDHLVLSNDFEYATLGECNWVANHGLNGRYLPPEENKLHEGGLVPGEKYEIETVATDPSQIANMTVWLVYERDDTGKINLW